jgi:hypothetical protein
MDVLLISIMGRDLGMASGYLTERKQRGEKTNVLEQI